jgi:hypothetical protein
MEREILKCGSLLWMKKHMRVCGTQTSERYKGTQKTLSVVGSLSTLSFREFPLYRFQGLDINLER